MLSKLQRVPGAGPGTPMPLSANRQLALQEAEEVGDAAQRKSQHLKVGCAGGVSGGAWTGAANPHVTGRLLAICAGMKHGWPAFAVALPGLPC